MSDIIVEKSSVELPENLIFGKILTPHVFEMDYSGKDGQWINPAIKELKNLELSPAAMVFHYGQAIFEGLKAYKRVDGKIGLFRPEKNFERLNRSARRMCIPEFDEEMVLNALKELIKLDQDWIPTKHGYSLYIRPLIFGMDPLLGVKPSQNYKFIIMLSPVGPYYPEGFKPVPILATDKYVRAVRDGVGDCKTAGNYAASLYAQVEAKKQGFTQVLFLDAIEKKYVEEVGTMNFFVHFKDEVATAKLNGSILPGITRLSVLQILKEWNFNVSERDISIDEIFQARENGNLVELFGTGTAAVISSISKLKYHDKEILFDREEPGELGMKLYKELSDIQYGAKEDTRGWITYVE